MRDASYSEPLRTAYGSAREAITGDEPGYAQVARPGLQNTSSWTVALGADAFSAESRRIASNEPAVARAAAPDHAEGSPEQKRSAA